MVKKISIKTQSCEDESKMWSCTRDLHRATWAISTPGAQPPNLYTRVLPWRWVACVPQGLFGPRWQGAQRRRPWQDQTRQVGYRMGARQKKSTVCPVCDRQRMADLSTVSLQCLNKRCISCPLLVIAAVLYLAYWNQSFRPKHCRPCCHSMRPTEKFSLN